MPQVPTLGRWRLEEQTFNASSGYKVSPGLPQPGDTVGGKEGRKDCLS